MRRVTLGCTSGDSTIEVAADGRVAHEAVRPLHVGPHARVGDAPEHGDARAQDVGAGVPLQGLGLEAQALLVGHVVGVHAGKETAAGGAKPGVERAHEAGALRAQDPHARILGGRAREESGGAVARAVVHRDHLVVAKALAAERGQAFGQGECGVLHGKEDADPRRFGRHSWRFTKARAARTAASAEAASTT